MRKCKKMSKVILALTMVSCMICSLASPAFAASWNDATINTEAPASITIHKYDWTNAVKDGVWNDSYISTGTTDTNVESILGGTARKNGDLNDQPDHTLGNSTSSNGYAIAGVEFSYLRVADFGTFTESVNDGHAEYNMTKVLYGFNKTETTELLAAIGLANGKDSYANAASTDKLDQNNWWYESDVINSALKASLAADATGVKDALETYIASKIGAENNSSVNNHADKNNYPDGGRMAFTDADGKSAVNGLETGLYLLVETKVPEMVTSTTNPFFISLPMTRVNGGGGMTGNPNETEGGHAWNYDVSVYPKNETGIVTLEKTVREAKDDTGKNEASDVITDGFAHNATASTGDIVEYQLISTLPSITSQATAISTYTFNDTIAPGLTYTDDANVKLQWYSDKECTKLVDTWTTADAAPCFTVTTDNAAHTREISMTAAGLAKINGSAATAGNVNNTATKYAGYSNYTVRITYTAQLNSDNSFVFGDSANCNKVVLSWKRTNTSYYDTILDDAHVYSYGIDLTKLFSDKTPDEAYGDGSVEQNMYNHVKFTLKNTSSQNGIHTDGYYVQAIPNEAEGVWYVTGHTPNESEATIFYPLKATYASSKPGHIIIKGIEDDVYEATELETANGYTLLKDRITVAISVTETAGFCDVYANEVKEGVYQNDGHYQYTGCPELKLANMPQQAMAHHLLTASATVDTNKVTMLNDFNPVDGTPTNSANALVPFSVTNTRGFDLPQTGENGATLMPLIGSAIVGVSMLAIIFLAVPLFRKKKNDNAQ